MLNQSEVLGTTEATECFFVITKLFQNKDTVLRRLSYLDIKVRIFLIRAILIICDAELWYEVVTCDV